MKHHRDNTTRASIIGATGGSVLQDTMAGTDHRLGMFDIALELKYCEGGDCDRKFTRRVGSNDRLCPCCHRKPFIVH
jgi:hypothetical protein